MYVQNHADATLAELRSGEIPAPESFADAASALRYLNQHAGGGVSNAGGVPVLTRGDGLPVPEGHKAIVRHWRDGILDCLRRGAR